LNPGLPAYETGEVHTESDEQLEAEDQQLLERGSVETNSGSIAGGLFTLYSGSRSVEIQRYCTTTVLTRQPLRMA
jgi:hypothetical protein